MNSDSAPQSDRDAIERARRLEELGFEVKSPSLTTKLDEINTFHDNGGNRAMRRSAKRAARKRGR